ncbi:hypothetical protein P9112_011502 [Eukaryota sp. TZLM1-RC]
MTEVDPSIISDLSSTVLDLLNLRESTWATFYTDASNQKLITALLSSTTPSDSLLFYTNTSGELQCTKPPLTSPLFNPSAKGTVVIRSKNTASFFDISLKSPVSHLNTLISSLLQPALFDNSSSPWPQVVLSDLKLHFDRLLTSTSSALSAVNGKTLLPSLIPSMETLELDLSNQGQLQRLEETVGQWRKIISAKVALVYGEGFNQTFEDFSNFGLTQEVDYWVSLVDDLKFIQSQLQSEESKMMADVLGSHSSKYTSYFSLLLDDVDMAIKKSSILVTALSPLRQYFEKIESFSDLSKEELISLCVKFPRLLRLFWEELCIAFGKVKAENPNSPSKFSMPVVLLVRLFGRIQFGLIYAVSSLAGCEGGNVFNNDSAEVLKILQDCKLYLKILGDRILAEKDLLRERVLDKESINTDSYLEPWTFSSSITLPLSEARSRIVSLESYITIVSQFSRLEKVEVGAIVQNGTEGSTRVKQIFEEFTQLLSEWQRSGVDPLLSILEIFVNHQYNPLSCDFRVNDSFTAQLSEFSRITGNWTLELAKLISQTFDSSTTITAGLTVFETFKCLVGRPEIKDIIIPRLLKALELFEEEIESLHSHFSYNKANPPLDNNMPPFAGQLFWTKMLKKRCEEPLSLLKQWNQDGSRRSSEQEVSTSILSHSKARRVVKRANEFLELISNHENQVYKDWADNAAKEAVLNLKSPLLKPLGEVSQFGFGFTVVNFDPKLVALLREIKYFQYMNLPIPEEALQVFEESSKYRHWVVSLNDAVRNYNSGIELVRQCDVEVFKPIIESISDEIGVLSNEVTWISESAASSIQSIVERTFNFKSLVSKLLANEDKINSFMDQLKQKPMLSRKKGKIFRITSEKEIETLISKITNVFPSITNTTQSISELLTDTLSTIKGKENDKFSQQVDPQAWSIYLEYVSNLIGQHLIEIIQLSFNHLLDQFNPNVTEAPLVVPEFFIDLDSRIPCFSPGDESDSISLVSVFELIISNIFKSAEFLIKPDGSNTNYSAEVTNSSLLEEGKSQILSTISSASSFLTKVKASFDKYSWLWKVSPEDDLEWFLVHGNVDRNDAELDQPEYTPQAPSLDLFEDKLKNFSKLASSLEQLPTELCCKSKCPSLISVPDDLFWLSIDITKGKHCLIQLVNRWSSVYVDHLSEKLVSEVAYIRKFIGDANIVFNTDLEGSVSSEDLSSIMRWILDIDESCDKFESDFTSLKEILLILKNNGFSDRVSSSTEEIDQLKNDFSELKKLSIIVSEKVAPFKQLEVLKVKERMVDFDDSFRELKQKFKSSSVTKFSENGALDSYKLLDQFEVELQSFEELADSLKEEQRLFDISASDLTKLSSLRNELRLLKTIWDVNSLVTSSLNQWKTTSWRNINTDVMEMATKNFNKDLRGLKKEVRAYDAYSGLSDLVTNFLNTVPLIADLRNDSMRKRHWKEIARLAQKSFEISDDFTLEDMLELELHKFSDDVSEIILKARKEEQIENTLSALEQTWRNLVFEFNPHADREGYLMVSVSDEVVEQLENDMVLVQNMSSSRHVAHFVDKVKQWMNALGTTDSVISTWLDVQKTWTHLQSIFKFSQDIREQLPDDAKRFDVIDDSWGSRIMEVSRNPAVIDCCCSDGFLEFLENMASELDRCQKSLDEYLDTKRRAFPRFYFISPADLLDILSKGTRPKQVQHHMGKIFDSIAKLDFQESDDDSDCIAIGMHAKDGEYVKFSQPVILSGQVENWLNRVVEAMQSNLKSILNEAVNTYDASRRSKWIFEYPAQICLVGSQIWWTSDVNYAFQKLVEGSEDALIDYNKMQQKQITELIKLIQGNLDKQTRLKICTLCTIEVHSRDVVADLIDQKVDSPDNFQWQKQLRLKWDDQRSDCFADICDAQFRYSYEYLGNTPRLVITPLTDRCYITLTQSLWLFMGGAPAGPAGTGKTETTKDLGRALGLMVYVFNCSEQMNFKSLGNIFKGLSASGSWGCFDEFNRISIEVLSVVASQVKSILDAVRGSKPEFWLLDEYVKLKPTVGVFITMNPGYAGRTELPENVKSLFRPVSMVVPDFQIIAEIMLMAEGFESAKLLALKFTTLYSLCKELLSKQHHYDWGLRAIKSVLVVAGSLKRAEPDVVEDNILMRALRDFNLPKIITEDVEVFMGLIGDLFPGLDLPRKVDVKFEDVVRQCCIEAGLQSDCDLFVLKVVQLKELLEVRHSVFVLGPAGSGKTCVWRILAASMKAYYGNKVLAPDINPKTQPANELYGFTNPATREWRDGLLSKTMRDLAELDDGQVVAPEVGQQAIAVSNRLKNLKKKWNI